MRKNKKPVELTESDLAALKNGLSAFAKTLVKEIEDNGGKIPKKRLEEHRKYCKKHDLM